MYKKNRQWYTYAECSAWFKHDKARTDRAWNNEHWTRAEVNAWESRPKPKPKPKKETAKERAWHRATQGKDSHSDDSDSEHSVNYGDYNPNDSD